MDTKQENNIFENLIGSYESRIQYIENIFLKSGEVAQSSFDLLQEFNSSLDGYKKEREKVNFELQKCLAQKASLRKKDYNRLMGDILTKLDEKEQEVGKYFSVFIGEQKIMTRFLKNGIPAIKESLSNGESGNVKLFREGLEHLTKDMEIKKKRVIDQLNGYREMHSKTIEKLKGLLAKEDSIHAKDVKEVQHELLTEMQ